MNKKTNKVLFGREAIQVFLGIGKGRFYEWMPVCRCRGQGLNVNRIPLTRMSWKSFSGHNMSRYKCRECGGVMALSLYHCPVALAVYKRLRCFGCGREYSKRVSGFGRRG